MSCGYQSCGVRWGRASPGTPIPRHSERLTPASARSKPAGASTPSAGWRAPGASSLMPASGPLTRSWRGTDTRPWPGQPPYPAATLPPLPDAVMTPAPLLGGAPTTGRRTLHGASRHRRCRRHAVTVGRSWRTIRGGRSGRGCRSRVALKGSPFEPMRGATASVPCRSMWSRVRKARRTAWWPGTAIPACSRTSCLGSRRRR